ncbi:MAG: ribosome biogenesis GTPase Der [Holosporaceae bacterium]|jgi:GTP-binding protein|nr:ribosome biogenesis GTPase Der [Holosporaceae bacterium]
MKKIAIIGRPNVGKSAIFNRLVGSNVAIVGDVPGITRDRKTAGAELFGLRFCLIDTPGVDPFLKNSENSLVISMNSQSAAAVGEADVVLFILDAQEGVTIHDREIANWLRQTLKIKGNRHVLLVKNKAEGRKSTDAAEVLGFGEGVFLSAEHNLGMDDLFEQLRPLIDSATFDPELVTASNNLNRENILKVAVVGRPNVGKSTLINAILGDNNRLLTGEQAGITRDAIILKYMFKNRPILLIDTAGQRKKSQRKDKIENVSILDAWRYLKQAHVALVLMDIQNPLEQQDITIASNAFDEGKIVIFALNKSDAVENPGEILESVRKRLVKEFAQLPGAACLLTSAREKKGLARIFNVAIELYDDWNRRVPTALLNNWLRTAVAENPPPLAHGTPLKLKYISQTNVRPPTFIVFTNKARQVPISYERYLLNHFRRSFSLYGVPLRLFLRQNA